MITESFQPKKNDSLNNAPRENRQHSWSGIKFFSGSSLPDYQTIVSSVSAVSAEKLREEAKVWRSEETLEAAEFLFTQGKVNIIGEPQSGKGTILFGLSEICDINGWGYVFIDGHHQESTAAFVLEAIEKANNKNIPIFYDSFDYLFGKGRKLRNIALDTHNERAKNIITALDKSTVPIAITGHDEQWTREFINLDLRNQFAPYLNKFPKYEIPDQFRSKESIIKFLVDHDMSVSAALFLVQMENNQGAQNRLTQILGDKDKVSEVFQAIQNYPVLKELVRDRKEETFFLLNQLVQNSNHSKNFDQLIGDLARIILEAQHKRTFLTLLRKRK